jgi:predicted dehydrogenase
MDKAIGVGIVGANAERGWASTAHIPALHALPGFELRALSTTRQQSAEEAGRKFSVSRTYSNHNELIAQHDVDLVVVTVQAARHSQPVMDALRAGKAVYCEWPLGIDLDQATQMAALAQEQEVQTIVGLQGRHAPEIEYLRDLIADGYLGQVLSTTIVGMQSTGIDIDPANAYMMEEANGANLLTISVGHSLDSLCFVLGDFISISGSTAVRRPVVRVPGSSSVLRRTSPDHVGLLGTLVSGASVTVDIHEGSAGGTGYQWEIRGTEGTLRLTADWSLPEIFPLTLWGSNHGGESFAALEVSDSYISQTPHLTSLRGTPAYNVGRTYASFARDQHGGTRCTANFSDAVARHTLLSAVSRSAASGRRIDLHE